MENAELLRMIRKLNGDVWLLLLCIVALMVAILKGESDRQEDKDFLYTRLARLELWRETAETVREARLGERARAADRPQPSDAVPAVKRTARKAAPSPQAVK
jgi:hypothetical protein